MLKLANISKQWKAAGAANQDISLLGFLDEHTAITKRGDLLICLRPAGIDYESLDGKEQEYAVRRLASANKAFVEGFHVYQYLFKSNRPEIPFASYGDQVVDAAIDQRRQFFAAKADTLYRIEIFYVIVMEGSQSKPGILSALKRFPGDPQAAIREIRGSFSGKGMKVLLRSQLEADQQMLRQKVTSFTRHLADLMQIEVLGQQEQFTLFRRLINFDDWRIAGWPKSTQFLDYQVVNSDIEAERDHLRIGDHYVRILTMREAISETRPMVLNHLLKIPASFYAVLEWSPTSAAKARKEIITRRRHFNLAKKSMAQSMREDTTRERDEMIDESKQADLAELGDCLVEIGNGQGMGGCSLTIVTAGRELQGLNRQIGEFASVFSNADGVLPGDLQPAQCVVCGFPRQLPITSGNSAS